MLPMLRSPLRFALATIAVSVGVAAAALAEPKPSQTPVVFVSGMTGTQLRDPGTGRTVWGRARSLVWPRDRGYELALPFAPNWPEHSQAAYEPIEPLWELRLLLWKKKIYRPLLRHLVAAGYERGELEQPRSEEDLFFFDYDWRRGNIPTAQRLAETLSRLALAAGATSKSPLALDLVCQSNAAKICRYVVKYPGLDLEAAEAGRSPTATSFLIRKLILIGASNGGALRTLEFLNRGRRYIPLLGRKMSQETFFSIRPLLADLPLHRTDLFFDAQGKTLDVDLLRPQTWVDFGWSVFGAKPQRRLERGRRPDLFGTAAERFAFLERQLDRAGRLHRLLSSDSPHFSSTRYYLMENESEPTAARALLHRVKGRWRLSFFDDRRVARDPLLRALALGAGDGHATLESQRELSPQENAAIGGARRIEGGHFKMIIETEGLNALLQFLAE